MLLGLLIFSMFVATVVFGAQHVRRSGRSLLTDVTSTPLPPPTPDELQAQGLRRADDDVSTDARDAVYVDAVSPDVELRVVDAFVIDVRMPAFHDERLLRCRIVPRRMGANDVDERDDQFAVHSDDPRRAGLVDDADFAAVLTKRVRRTMSDVREILVDERGLWLRYGRGGGTTAVELRRALDVGREVAAAFAAAVQRLPAPPPRPPRALGTAALDRSVDDAVEPVPQTTAGRDGSSVAIPALGTIRKQR